jgi:HEAT repeat protein
MSALSAQEPPAVVCYTPSPAQGTEALELAKLLQRALAAQHQIRAVPPAFDVLSPWVAAALADRWQEPCEGAFEYLATRYPASLLGLIISGRLDPADLTFAAEIAGRLRDDGAVRRALVPLLSHPEAVVREGAIYGLARHLDAGVRTLLERLAAADPSAAGRTAAADALDEG